MAYDDCDCGMTPNMTYDELLELSSTEGTCTSGERFWKTKGYPKPNIGWVCSNFLRELERATKEKRSKAYRNKLKSPEGEISVKEKFNKKRKFPSGERTYKKGSLKDLQ